MSDPRCNGRAAMRIRGDLVPAAQAACFFGLSCPALFDVLFRHFKRDQLRQLCHSLGVPERRTKRLTARSLSRHLVSLSVGHASIGEIFDAAKVCFRLEIVS